MKTPSSEFQIGAVVQPRSRKRKRKTVAEILKAAYRRFVRDRSTRVAVRRCLGA